MRTVDSTRALLVGLVAIASLLRLWGLGSYRLGFDESFTAMAGRLPIGGLFEYLRVRDSHPPLDYLLHLPFARLGADEFLFRLPSTICSIAAVALFAWWLRNRGFAGLVATGLLAVSAFQLTHGREARMYAEMELIGVATAVLADAWLRRPRRWHTPAIGALVLVGLLTHVSMFLLGAGLLVLAGRRPDREAWRWRVALGAGLAAWAALWGASFLAQARGGNSDWIPHTTLSGVVHTFGRLVTNQPELHLVALAGIGVGAVLLGRLDRTLSRVWLCCVLVPAALAALTGTVAPVLLDRTLTVVSWGPLLAIAVLVAAVARRSRTAGAVAIVALMLMMLPPAVRVITKQPNPDRVLRHIERVARPGDVLAIHPGGRLHELGWSLGVRSGEQFRVVGISGLPRTSGIFRGVGPSSGRIWLIDWTKHRLPVPTGPRCAPDWVRRGARVYCLVSTDAARVARRADRRDRDHWLIER